MNNKITDILQVLKYIDEIKEHDKAILNDIYYGSLHDSIFGENIDADGSNDTQYDTSYDTSHDNLSNDTYHFLTDSY